jgi:hypothetical protein
MPRVQRRLENVSEKMALRRAESYESLGMILTVRHTLSWPNMKKPLIIKEKSYTALSSGR